MKVFGIGLNITGTTSLGKSPRILGFKKQISWNLQLTVLWSEGNIKRILNNAKNFNNFEDLPWPLLYKELYEEFDNAKFILTTRKSSTVWYESLCKHASRPNNTPDLRRLVYGYDMPQDYKDEHIQYYEKHNKDVIEFFNKHAPDKLLVICIEDEDNFKKISDFLGKETPNRKFPFLNKAR